MTPVSLSERFVEASTLWQEASDEDLHTEEDSWTAPEGNGYQSTAVTASPHVMNVSCVVGGAALTGGMCTIGS